MVNLEHLKYSVAIFLHTCLRVLSSQQRITAYGRSTGCIAATKLVWTAAAAVILNGSEASAPLANGRGLKCIARRCINSFGGQRGSLKSPLPTVLPMMVSCFPRPKHDQPFCSQILSVSRGCKIRSGSGLRMKLYDDPNPSWPEEMSLRYMSF